MWWSLAYMPLPKMPLFCTIWAYVIFWDCHCLWCLYFVLSNHMSFSVIVTAYDASILFQLSICHFCYYSSTHWMSSLIEFSFWDCHFLLPMMPLFCCNWAYVIFSASIQVKLSICNDEFFELSLLLNLAHCPILLSTTTTVLLLMVLVGCCSLLIYYSILLQLTTLLLLYAPTTCSLLLLLLTTLLYSMLLHYTYTLLY